MKQIYAATSENPKGLHPGFHSVDFENNLNQNVSWVTINRMNFTGDRLLGFKICIPAKDTRKYNLHDIPAFVIFDGLVLENIESFVQEVFVPPKNMSFHLKLRQNEIPFAKWEAGVSGGTIETNETFDTWFYFPEFYLFRGSGFPVGAISWMKICVKFEGVDEHMEIFPIWAFDCFPVRRCLYRSSGTILIPPEHQISPEINALFYRSAIAAGIKI